MKSFNLHHRNDLISLNILLRACQQVGMPHLYFLLSHYSIAYLNLTIETLIPTLKSGLGFLKTSLLPSQPLRRQTFLGLKGKVGRRSTYRSLRGLRRPRELQRVRASS